MQTSLLSRTIAVQIKNEAGLAPLARALASRLKRGDVVALMGGLGVGKTALARALLHALNPAIGNVPSPTFPLVQTYETSICPVWHFDLYRLQEKEVDILELGWDEARRYGISIVEWPERLGRLMPESAIHITLSAVEGQDTVRDIRISAPGLLEDAAFVKDSEIE